MFFLAAVNAIRFQVFWADVATKVSAVNFNVTLQDFELLPIDWTVSVVS